MYAHICVQWQDMYYTIHSIYYMYTPYTTRSAKLTSGGAGSLHFADMILFAALNACSELVRFGVVFPGECARPRVKPNIIPIFLRNRQICAPGNSNTAIYDQFPIARVFHRKLQTNHETTSHSNQRLM